MTHYEKFHQLHHQSTPLILANVWNVKSAQIAAASGFEAVATSSGALAESLGYKDGEQIPFAELLYVVQRINASISIPLSVDLERGYTDNPDLLNEHIQQLLQAGVAGINIEDAQGEETFLKKLNSIKSFLATTQQQLFINARIDAFLQKLDAPLETTLRRAQLYRQAGADGLFVPAVPDTETIQKIAAATTLPLNVVGLPKIGSVATLASCGVKRISMAVLLYKATYNKMETMAREILQSTSLETLFQK